MNIEYDLAKATSNLQKHGVSFDEASTALLDDNALVMEDLDSNDEDRWVLVGLSNQARLLTVIYTLRKNSIRRISARKATKKESNYYA
ncbi:MAG: BrnT family toxin [Pseudohongiellaceae bacterium]